MTAGGTSPIYGSVAVVNGNVFTDLSTSVFLRRVTNIMVGPNVHNAVSTDVYVETGCQAVFVAPQATYADNKTLWRDSTYGSSSHTGISTARHETHREIPSTTSSSTYTTLWTLTPAQNSAGFIEVALAGNVVGSVRTRFAQGAASPSQQEQ
jgi:hypothetical protein